MSAAIATMPGLPSGVEDPRPDLFTDASEWVALLTLAYEECHPEDPFSTYGVLVGFRAMGCRLWRDEYGRLRLESGELDADAYHSLRATYLLPRAAEVTRLLQGEGGR